MKAAVLTGFRQPLEIRDVPDPKPGDSDALVRVEACGICRSDWHLWQEDWTWAGLSLPLPCVMGHEVGGTVLETGRNVKRFKAGDRVTIPFHLACGLCEFCHTGRSNLCGPSAFWVHTPAAVTESWHRFRTLTSISSSFLTKCRPRWPRRLAAAT